MGADDIFAFVVYDDMSFHVLLRDLLFVGAVFVKRDCTTHDAVQKINKQTSTES